MLLVYNNIKYGLLCVLLLLTMYMILGESKRLEDCSFHICENTKSYPEEKIREIIEKNAALHSYFGDIIEPANATSILSRLQSQDLHPEPFCKTLDVTKFPKLMTDVDNIARIIANIQNFTQAIKFQTCENTNGEGCFGGNLHNFETRCMQKFNIVKLVTVDADNGVLEYRKFRIPSTCVCTYIKTSL